MADQIEIKVPQFAEPGWMYVLEIVYNRDGEACIEATQWYPPPHQEPPQGG